MSQRLENGKARQRLHKAQRQCTSFHPLGVEFVNSADRQHDIRTANGFVPQGRRNDVSTHRAVRSIIKEGRNTGASDDSNIEAQASQGLDMIRNKGDPSFRCHFVQNQNAHVDLSGLVHAVCAQPI
ncbi:unannotated protein [freshwater metagenome]|uniref:Unannotated protein n=1 Tax=freshwater metagenome TaxID=449393 RepID=A0A6J6XWK4_9ZZZZ